MIAKLSIYETTFVIDSLQKSEDMRNLVTKIESFIKNNGGEIAQVEDWGKRRLAHEINRKQYGNYYQVHFDGPSNLPELLEREYRLEEAILRFLTIKSHPKAEEARAKLSQGAKEKLPARPTESKPEQEAKSEGSKPGEPVTTTESEPEQEAKVEESVPGEPATPTESEPEQAASTAEETGDEQAPSEVAEPVEDAEQAETPVTKAE